MTNSTVEKFARMIAQQQQPLSSPRFLGVAGTAGTPGRIAMEKEKGGQTGRKRNREREREGHSVPERERGAGTETQRGGGVKESSKGGGGK